MKRFLVVCAAAMLCCSLARGQEAEDSGRGAGLSIIPRVDIGLLYDLEDKSASVNFGNTSLYTIFDGNILENLSFSLVNHWVASDWAYPTLKEGIGEPTAALYHFNMFGKGVNANNFVDNAYICWTPLDFEFTLGKVTTLVGGFELDDYDFDVNPLMASDFWSAFTCYQWGVGLAYNLPREIGKISFQATTNAVNRSISLGFGWDGTYGPYSMKWSALVGPSYFKHLYPDAPWNVIVTLGNKLELGNFTFTADFTNACGDPNLIGDGNYLYSPSVYGNTIVSSLIYNIEDVWEVGIKGAWNKADKNHPYGYIDKNHTPYIPDSIDIPFSDLPSLTAGAWASWYPLPDDQSLRVQASAGVNSYRKNGSGYVFALLGVTYNFSLKLW